MANYNEETVPGAMRSVDWQAVFAGLVFVIAGNWILFLLGTAIGVSIADASDMAALGDGLGFGTFIWLIISGILIYFAAGYMTTRLARNVDHQQGMLQALTLWSSATVLTIVLGSMGVSSVLSAGQSVLSGVASIGTSAASGAGSAIDSFIDSGDMKKLTRQIRDEAAQLAASSERGDVLSKQEATKAMSQLDSKVVKGLAQQLAQGNTTDAIDVLKSETTLSKREINSLINGITRSIRKNTPVEDVEKMVMGQYRELSSALASSTGADISGKELRQTVQSLDQATLTQIARELLTGDVEAAKQTLTESTELSEKNVETVVSNIQETYEEQIEAVESAVESAESYGTVFAWALFLATLASLGAALAGGRKGVDSVHDEL